MADPIRDALERAARELELVAGSLTQAGWAAAGSRARNEAHPPAPTTDTPLDLDALLSPEGAYEPGTGHEEGAQLVDQLEWWAPVHGCDTLETLLDQIRDRILPHLRPPIAGIDVPGPDGDYGDVLDLCAAEGVDPQVGVPLLKRARDVWFPATPADGPAAEEGEAVPTIDDIWDLCEKYDFRLGVDGTDEEEGAEMLRDIILTALARWGRPTTPPAPASDGGREELGEVRVTLRGFEVIEFLDCYDKPCSLQQSSFAICATPGASAIWLGQDGNRMHLNEDQAKALITHLQRWLDSGSFRAAFQPLPDPPEERPRD